MLQDLRFAVRLLVKERWFSAVAIVALSLGIGLNATVFTLVNAVLIRGLPFKDSQDLYMVAWQVKKGGQSNISFVDFKEWRGQTKAFSGLGGWTGGSMNISDDRGMPEQARGTYMTANAFSVVGQRPLLGRDFVPEDEQRGSDRAVIIGYTLWRNRYGGDSNVIGKLTRINGEPAVIVGVMPEAMMFPQNSEIWAAFIPNEQQERRTWRGLAVFGRVHPGTGRTAALAEMDTLAARVKTEFPKDYEELGGMILETFNQRFNGGPIRAVFLSMMGAVAFVLLIACANVANLLLSRSASRAREVAIRLAMGATRWRIIRQLLIESILLGAIGGLLGLGIAMFGVRAFDAAVADSGKPYWIKFTIDYTVVAFLAGVCLLAGVLFGLAPALHVSRTNVHGVLKEGGRGNAGGGRVRWLTGTMVVVEVALTLVLLVGAGLMVRSFLNLYRVDIGMRTDRLMAINLQLAGEKYQKPEARRAFYERLQPRLGAIPGAEHVALTTSIPAFGVNRRPLEVDGRPAPKIDDAPTVGAVTISPAFFDVAGVAVVRGRGFTDADGGPGAETSRAAGAAAGRMAHHRRHRSDPPSHQHPGCRLGGGRLSASAPGPARLRLGDHAQLRRARYAHGRRAQGSAGHRSRSAGVQPADNGPDDEEHDVAVPGVRLAVHHLRVHRPDAVGGRTLRRHGLCGDAADPGDRRAHGAWCPGQPGDVDGPEARPVPARSGAGVRPRRRVLRRACAAGADPRPHHGDRSVGVHRHHARAQHRGDHRVPRAGPTGDARRPAGRAAGGVRGSLEL